MKSPFCFFYILLFLGGNITAQILAKLDNLGFENLTEFYKDDDYSLCYENNRYRFEAEALSRLLKHLEFNPKTKNVHLLLLNVGVPMFRIHDEATVIEELQQRPDRLASLKERFNFSFDVDRLYQKFEDKKRTKQSFKKIDLALGVHINYTLGNFDNSIRQKINIQPQFSIVIGAGFSVLGIYNFPSFNELDQNRVNLVLGRVSQECRFKNNLFTSLNVGFFHPNRFGFHSTFYQYFDQERFLFDFQCGRTLEAFLNPDFQLVQRSGFREVLHGAVTYRWNKFDTDISFRYGTYLMGDLGYKVRLERYFDETLVGLFLNKTSYGQVTGFDFHVPFYKKNI